MEGEGRGAREGREGERRPTVPWICIESYPVSMTPMRKAGPTGGPMTCVSGGMLPPATPSPTDLFCVLMPEDAVLLPLSTTPLPCHERLPNAGAGSSMRLTVLPK